jgi:hypothetical protein
MKSNPDRTLPQADRHNVVMFPQRRPQPQQRVAVVEEKPMEMRRYPVDIRGNVTFGRLMQGLATVGLTVRLDPRTGHVVIADDPFE